MANSKTQDQLINKLGELYSKAPNLPKEWVATIVKLTPWIALIFGILGVLGSITAFGVFSAISPVALMGGGINAIGGGVIAVGLSLVSSALLLAAFPGTKENKISGWNLLFWSEMVSAVSSVLSFALGGLVGTVVGFYILFQIKSYYK